MNKTRAKMPREARAKQFMPFSALNGLELALGEKEVRNQKKAQLDGEEIEKINRALQKLSVGDKTGLVYFYAGIYTPISGKVTKLNSIKQYLEIDGIRVYFDDILRFVS